MKTLEDLSGSKLHPGEQEVVREAADALLFCEDLESDHATHAALAELFALLERLMDSERLIPETAGSLTAAVEACGPLVATPA